MEVSQTNKTILEQVNDVSNDIVHKLSEVNDGSETQKFLLLKKQTIDNALQKIVDGVQKEMKYDYELMSLFDKMETLRNKIHAKASRPKDDDEDMKEFKELQAQHNWIQRIKAKSC